MKNKKVLVFSAHAADFVWRCGGAVAKYIKNGADVKIVVLSFGVRGESNDLWKAEGQTTENVKTVRRAESTRAASILGVTDIDFWDLEDYPMDFTRDILDRMTRTIREFTPDIILTHDWKDAFNPDHENVAKNVFQASVMSTSNGVRMEGTKTMKQMAIFGFEPHQTEISEFKPNSIIDITEVFELKKEAMQVFQAQKHLIEYYSSRASMRGNHARRISGNQEFKFAEAFSNFFPYVGGEFGVGF